MAVKSVLMNAGDGETSYAKNSVLQKIVIRKAQPIMDEALKNMSNEAFPQCFRIADLGCSSGPNAFYVLFNIIDTIHGLCQQNNQKAPEFQVFLNDLPGNDFNTLFKYLPDFYYRLKKEKGDKFGACFISATPGTFYGRLFPSKSLHFVHSSYSVHWLSQVPEGLENNKRNIYLATMSPPDVFEAYLKQFQEDFSTLLKLRFEEMVPDGRMVLTFLARSVANIASKDCSYQFTLVTKSLLDMVAEGLIKEDDVNSFNLPMFIPHESEVKAIIQKEGSFNLDRLEVFEIDWDLSKYADNQNLEFDKYRSAKIGARVLRAFMEPMLASHFGDSIIDNLFMRYTEHVAQYLSVKKDQIFNMVISLTKK